MYQELQSEPPLLVTVRDCKCKSCPNPFFFAAPGREGANQVNMAVESEQDKDDHRHRRVLSNKVTFVRNPLPVKFSSPMHKVTQFISPL
jgi:hypothetical protein